MRAGTATYVSAWAAHHPACRQANDHRLEALGTTAEWVDAHLGVRERRVASSGETPAELGAVALREACRRAGVEPAELDLVIGASSFDDHDMPALAARLAARVGSGAFAFDVRAACSGWLVGLQQASAAIVAGRAERVAVCAAEVTTTGVDPADRTSVPLFGDAAAAAIVTRSRPSVGLEVVDLEVRADNQGHDAVVLPHPGWFAMDGGRARDWVESTVPELATGVLARHGLGPADVRGLVCHQANLRLLERVADRLDVPAERHWHNVGWAGNTAAAGAPSALAAALDAHRSELADGDAILVVTVGAGLNAVAALLRWVQG